MPDLSAVLPECPPKQTVVGVGISTTSYREVAGVCRRWIDSLGHWRQAGRPAALAPPGRYITVTSVHGAMEAFWNPEFRQVLNGADIATPDGMPLVWALRSMRVRGQQRVYGPNLMLELCQQAARLGHGIFLYGGRPERLEELQQQLQARFPGLVIAGACSPPFRPLTREEDEADVARLQESEADIVFVGLSTPKQERWMAAHRDRLPGVVLIGVGAAFDFHAGRVPQAPAWVQQSGLEWFFRLLMEPRRLWKRYLLVTPLFLPLWALQRIGILRYESNR